MPRGFGALALVAALVAPSAAKRGAVSEREAVARFERFWRTELQKAPGVARVDHLVDEGKPSVRRMTLRAYRKFVADRLGPRERNEAVLFGTLAGLDRDGECWQLHYDGRLGGGLNACVEDAVLFVWLTPEG